MASDVSLITEVLRVFVIASGLNTNIQESSASPIQCLADLIEEVQQHLPCAISEFPCTYLGLPLSIRKLSKAAIQPLIDRVADQLPGWKADLMNRAGRLMQVKFVMTATVIYCAIALDLPSWAIKAIDKIRKGFLWRERKEANGDHCLLAWLKVCRPLELAGALVFMI